MADSVIYMGTQQNGNAVPIKVVDNGDGTYKLSTTTTNGAGVTMYLGVAAGSSGIGVPLKAVSNGDGTYSLLVS